MRPWPRTIEMTLCAERTIWQSPDGNWRVVCSVSLFGLSDIYHACHRTTDGWQIVKAHRESGAAWRTLERAMMAHERAQRRAAKMEAKREERSKKRAVKAARRRRRARSGKIGQRLMFA